jgi:hypothetical protein
MDGAGPGDKAVGSRDRNGILPTISSKYSWKSYLSSADRANKRNKRMWRTRSLALALVTASKIVERRRE